MKPDSDETTDQETLQFERALSIAVVKVYNDKLRERLRKKRNVHEHGLINSHLHWAARDRNDSTVTHHVYERLSVFSQMFKFQEQCRLFEGWHGHVARRQRIQQMQRYRHLGIKTLASTKLYGSLQSRREKHMKQWKQFSANFNVAFPVQHQHQQLVTSAQLQGSNGNNVWVHPSGHFPQQKGSVPPTDIAVLLGYDK